MSVYYFLAKFVAFIHLIMIGMNIISVPFLIVTQPFYIWMPIITCLVSPVLGGTYCMFNRLENFFRAKAGMPLITDRLAELFGR